MILFTYLRTWLLAQQCWLLVRNCYLIAILYDIDVVPLSFKLYLRRLLYKVVLLSLTKLIHSDQLSLNFEADVVRELALHCLHDLLLTHPMIDGG